jgi:threonine/homoserine/homoserine lactone efflux protein
MDYILHVFYGIIMAYFGLISPGMLNMTALKIRINNGISESVKFAIGASVIVFIQAGIALYFADYFNKNPQIIERLKIAGVVVFLILSIFFLYLSRKELNPKASNTKGNYFLKGIGMSSINMLGIPFYLGISIFLAAENKILIEQPYIILFVFGASIGSFLLFSTYIIFAKYISDKVSFIAKNINLILSILFLGLGMFTLVKILF